MTRDKTDISVEEDLNDARARRKSGEFLRGVNGFRNQIGDVDFPAEPGRHHLFVAFNCPWSHRAALARGVVGLENSITMDVAFPSLTNSA